MNNNNLFWMKMKDAENGLGVKTMSDLVIKEIHGIFNTRRPTLNQIRRYKRSLADFINNCEYSDKVRYVRSDLMEKTIKNCRGVKKSNRDNTNRENFRILLRIKENDVSISKEALVLNNITTASSNETILFTI